MAYTVQGFTYIAGPAPVAAIFTVRDNTGEVTVWDALLDEPLGTQEQFDALLAAGAVTVRT